MDRVICAKVSRPLIFARHVEAEDAMVWKPMSAVLNGKPNIALLIRYF